jgi:antibiotic biosynthesis monooxygenase (ABM) superfamily enzyme
VLTRIWMNLLSWLAAFLIVLGLFTLFGTQLAAQSLPIRALIVSGVMVLLMLNLVVPILRRMLGGRRQKSSAKM